MDLVPVGEFSERAATVHLLPMLLPMLSAEEDGWHIEARTDMGGRDTADFTAYLHAIFHR